MGLWLGPSGPAEKHIGKIIAVIAILLLLPVLFLLMLPGLIFGGLVNAFSPADPDTPILNSETAIVENANDITFAINAILGEALDDVMAPYRSGLLPLLAPTKWRSKTPILPAWSTTPTSSSRSIVLARDEDFESISLDGLASALRRA